MRWFSKDMEYQNCLNCCEMSLCTVWFVKHVKQDTDDAIKLKCFSSFRWFCLTFRHHCDS